MHFESSGNFENGARDVYPRGLARARARVFVLLLVEKASGPDIDIQDSLVLAAVVYLAIKFFPNSLPVFRASERCSTGFRTLSTTYPIRIPTHPPPRVSNE